MKTHIGKDFPLENINGEVYKKCTKCLELKPIIEFYVDLTKSNGHRTICITCTKKKMEEYRSNNKEKINLKRIETSYGLTEIEFNLLALKQNNLCAICKKSMLIYRGAHIDHDKLTGKVRGLLCMNCNLGIGSLKHNVEILINAISYLYEMPESQVIELQEFLAGKSRREK